MTCLDFTPRLLLNTIIFSKSSFSRKISVIDTLQCNFKFSIKTFSKFAPFVKISTFIKIRIFWSGNCEKWQFWTKRDIFQLVFANEFLKILEIFQTNFLIFHLLKFFAVALKYIRPPISLRNFKMRHFDGCMCS